MQDRVRLAGKVRLFRQLISNFIIFFLFFFSWYLYYQFSEKSLLLPSPLKVLDAFLTVMESNLIISNVTVTFLRSSVGFLLSLSMSVLLAIFMWQNKTIKEFLHDFVIFIQSITIIVWIIIFLVMFGLTSNWPATLVATIVSFPLMLNNLEKGIENVDDKLIEMVKVHGATADDIIFDVVMPSLKPYLFSGVRSGMSMALKVSVVAEAFTSSKGIGYQIMVNFNLFHYELAFAWALLIISLLILFDWTLMWIFETPPGTE